MTLLTEFVFGALVYGKKGVAQVVLADFVLVKYLFSTHISANLENVNVTHLAKQIRDFYLLLHNLEQLVSDEWILLICDCNNELGAQVHDLQLGLVLRGDGHVVTAVLGKEIVEDLIELVPLAEKQLVLETRPVKEVQEGLEDLGYGLVGDEGAKDAVLDLLLDANQTVGNLRHQVHRGDLSHFLRVVRHWQLLITQKVLEAAEAIVTQGL